MENAFHMNLTIDQGNTSTKIAIFEQDHCLIEFSVSDEELEYKLIELLSTNTIQNSILSSVIHTSSSIIQLLQSKSEKFIELNDKTLLPIKNL